MANVGKYTIHGCYGLGNEMLLFVVFFRVDGDVLDSNIKGTKRTQP